MNAALALEHEAIWSLVEALVEEKDNPAREIPGRDGADYSGSAKTNPRTCGGLSCLWSVPE